MTVRCGGDGVSGSDLAGVRARRRGLHGLVHDGAADRTRASIVASTASHSVLDRGLPAGGCDSLSHAVIAASGPEQKRSWWQRLIPRGKEL